MCGHVGIFRTKYNENLVKHKDLFSTMLFTDYIRGKDSTGVCIVHSDKVIKGGKLDHFMYKRALASYDFMFMPGYGKAMSFTRPVLMMGHNRAATRGTVTDYNAHPFEAGDIILAHNGTLTNKHLLEDNRCFDTDSEVIAHLLNKYNDVEKVANMLEGAYALVWWNKKERSLNFLRNDTRELWYSEINNGSAIVWGSFEHIIRMACEHNEITIDGEDEKNYGTVWKIDPNHHFKFLEGNVEPEIIEIKIKPKKANTQGWGWPDRGHQTRRSSSSRSTQSTDTGSMNERLKKKKGILTMVLQGFVGLEVPFILNSYHAYTLKDTEEKDKSVHGFHVVGKLTRDFSTKLLPELPNDKVTVRGLKEGGEGTEISSKRGVVWAGRLTEFKIAPDADEVGLTIENPHPFPQYNIGDIVKKLENDTGSKLDLVKGPKNLFIPITDFKIMTQDGCCCCKEDIDPALADDVEWIYEDLPVCPQCVSNGNMDTAMVDFSAVNSKRRQ